MSQSGQFLTKKKKSNFLRPPRRLGGLKTKRPPKDQNRQICEEMQ